MSREERKHNKGTSDKELMRMYRKQRKLFSAICDLGYEELETPIRRGYEKKFVLRADIARSKKAVFLNPLLDMVNTPICSRDKEFMVKDYKTKTMKPQEHRLDVISKKEYQLLTPKKQSYFGEDYYYNWMHQRSFRGYMLNLPLWYFSTKVSPHYIYRVRLTDLEMEKEHDEINDYFISNNLWGRIDHILGIQRNNDDWYIPGRVAKEQYQELEDAKEIRAFIKNKGVEVDEKL